MTTATTVTNEMIDDWAENLAGPVALHLRQKLLPVEGSDDAVIFPATYAEIGYNIDEYDGGKKVAQIDSVGAQANRMEPLFKRGDLGRPENPLAKLVPQVDIAVGNIKVSILEAGHRLGDAVVRASDLAADAENAFSQFQRNGDANAIAKLAPTSLVFGAWDSRGEGAKLPRVVNAVIRAWDVSPLTRSAQYNPPVDYGKLDLFSEEDKKKLEDAAGNTKSPLAQRGFVHVPAVAQHGGVRVHGNVCRDVTVNLVALRRLGGENGAALRRYILGLALVAAVEPQDGFLRQGCLLTLDPGQPAVWAMVDRRGTRTSIAIDEGAARSYAFQAADRFGVGPDRQATFLKDRAKADLGDGEKKGGRKKGDKGGAAGSEPASPAA